MRRRLLLLACFLCASSTVSATPEALDAAKRAFTAGEYEQSILVLRELLDAEEALVAMSALEYLGVAYQHLGQIAEAEAVFQRFLREHANEAAAVRVQQRLDALALQQRERGGIDRPIAARRRASNWDVRVDLSQEFWRFAAERDGLGETDVASSLLSWADLDVRRSGTRFDTAVRVNAGYLHDLDASTPTGQQANALVSNAYVNVADNELNWHARLGRQTLYADGVFGRFDGLRVSKALNERYRVNLNAGLPVDAPGFVADGDRQFVAASVDGALFDDRVQLNGYGVMGQIDGIADRQAVGGRAALRRERWSLQGAVDYDVSYNALNSALLQGDWRLLPRLSAYARAHFFASPLLLTRNALIGQPVATLDALRDRYSTSQLRFLARQRTRDASLFALGSTYRLSERWLAKADVSYYSADDLPGVDGLAGLPSETHIVSRASLTGTSLFRGRDTTILTAQLSSNKRYDLLTTWFDYRLPLGSKLRIAPRLALSLRSGGASVDDAWIATPSVRVLYRPRPRYRLELELGGRWMQQDLERDPLLAALLNADSELSTELFVNLSWRMSL